MLELMYSRINFMLEMRTFLEESQQSMATVESSHAELDSSICKTNCTYRSLVCKKRFAKNGFPKTVCQETVFRKRCSKTRFFCHNNVFPPRTVLQTCFFSKNGSPKMFFNAKSGFPQNGLPQRFSKNSFPITVFQQNKRFAKKRSSTNSFPTNDLPRNGFPKTFHTKKLFSKPFFFFQLDSSIRQTHHGVIACIMFQATNNCSQLLQCVNLHMSPTACGCACHLPEERVELDPPPDFAYWQCICVHCGPVAPNRSRRCTEEVADFSGCSDKVSVKIVKGTGLEL